MRLLKASALLLAASAGGAFAQVTPPPPSPAPNVIAQSGEPAIVVTGQRTRPSKWRVAETPHVVVLSDGSERELTEIAHDLEREYFLLSVLLGRPDQQDDTVKLRVTLIGDAAEFQTMDLKNLRWQQGPFNEAFDISRYYDPREDGAVLASTRIDQKVVLQRGQDLAFALQGLNLSSNDPPVGSPGSPGSSNSPSTGSFAASAALFGLQSEHDLIPPVNESSVPVTASSLFYAGFAQHYLQTFFPAAYPRWFMDGFGQIFSSMTFKGDGVVEYGRVPFGTTAVLEKFGSYPLSDVLSGKYLGERPSRTRWTPVHAWMLTHFLFFSPTRNTQLKQYLHAIATGKSAEDAATAFGDQATLARELRTYYHSRKPFERMTYPPERAIAPAIRRLSEGDAAFVKGRLELGSRVEIPPAPAPDIEPKLAAQMTAARTRALSDRERWLARLRADAARYPGDEGAQLLLAEAECRSGNPDRCAAAADRLLAHAPANSAALAWKGLAAAQLAGAGDPSARADGLKAARAMIGRANRADSEAVLPLIAYYRSFADVGEKPPLLALDGMIKALDEVPNSPATRLALGVSLAQQGFAQRARSTLQPVANGAYDSPERPPARAVLAGLNETALPVR